MLTEVKNIQLTDDGLRENKDLTPPIMVVSIQYDDLLPFPLDTEQFSEILQDVKVWKHSRHEVLLSIDALIQALHSCKGKDIFSILKPEGVNNDLWKRFLHSVEPLAESWTSQTNKVLIIVDDNMHLRSMRYEYYKLARAKGAGYCQIFMEISPENALVRNSQRPGDHKVANDVILRMAKTFEIPDRSKNSWEKFSMTIPYESAVQMDEIISFLRAAFANPFQPLQSEKNEVGSFSRSQCSLSLIHQADLILRKCVSLWLAECKISCTSSELPQCVQHASHIKELILSKLRNEEIDDVPCFETASLQHAAQDPECLLFKFIKNLFFTNIKNGF
ncbi:hypothetical protein Btru_032279 [Bulinus truncatus]|nr:hypothetical protein Btru_032279 [Bulinus truncatus]